MKQKTKEITVRPLRKSDIPKVRSLIKNHLDLEENWTYKGDPWYYWTLSNMFSETCLVAEKEEKIVGFVAAYKNQSTEKDIFIEDIIVDHKVRRTGLGTKMISTLIQKAANKNCKSIWGTIDPTNKISIDFFKACGFENKTEEFSPKIDFNGNGKIGKINEEVTFLNLKGQGEHRCIYQQNLS